MRCHVLIATILVACAALSYGEDDIDPSLIGMQAIHVYCDSAEKADIMRQYEGMPGFDFVHTRGDVFDVFVDGNLVDVFKQDLADNKISYSVFIEDMREKVVEERISQEKARRGSFLKSRASASSSRLPFNYYLDYNEIVAHLKEFTSEFSDVTRLFSIGKSYEGRTIYAVKVSSGPARDGPKPAIVIDAGIHAREWIAPATALYTLDQLAANSSNSFLLDHIDWIIVPVLNPDGYQYTHTSNRMWRKTRSVDSSGFCIGVDANRNFDMKWMVAGASNSPCSDIYAGPKPFSEPETQALRDFILSLNKTAKTYLTLHSYGQYLLYPWGYTTALPPNEPELRAVAQLAAKTIAAVFGTKYTYGTSANALYAAAGGSDDWAMAKGGCDLSYTIELPGGGSFGFDLPAHRIKDVGFETFQAMRAFHSYTEAKYARYAYWN